MSRRAILFLSIFMISLVILAIKISSPFGYVFWFGFYLFWVGAAGCAYLAGNKLRRKQFWLYKSIGYLIISLAILLSTLVVIGSLDYRILLPMTSAFSLGEGDIQEDVVYFEKTRQAHPAYQSDNYAENQNTDGQLSRLRSDLNRSDQIRVYTELTGRLRDGHSFVMPFQFYNRSRYYPMLGHQFEDGFYILKTASKYKDLRDAKLTAINDRPVGEVINLIEEYSGAENKWNNLSRINLYLFSKLTLHHLNIVDDESDVQWTFLTSEGEVITKTIRSEPFINYLFWALKPGLNPLPVLPHLRKPNFRLLEKDNVLILEMNLIENISDKETIGNLAEKIRDRLASGGFEKFVIDLRNNTGGNNTLYDPIIEVILENESINTAEHLFAFISRNTFSAGINMVDDLRFQTNIMLVGEPTGAGATHYGDAQLHTLPKSGIIYFMSTKQWMANDTSRARDAIYPEVSVRFTFEDFKLNKDPWWEGIRSFF